MQVFSSKNMKHGHFPQRFPMTKHNWNMPFRPLMKSLDFFIIFFEVASKINFYTYFFWSSWCNGRVNACYGVDKKLSQFDSFQYQWNFDISWWMFGKHFVTKFSINGGLHPNISLYHEIQTNMKKLIINWSTFSLCNNPITMLQLQKRTMKDYI